MYFNITIEEVISQGCLPNLLSHIYQWYAWVGVRQRGMGHIVTDNSFYKRHQAYTLIGLKQQRRSKHFVSFVREDPSEPQHQPGKVKTVLYRPIFFWWMQMEPNHKGWYSMKFYHDLAPEPCIHILYCVSLIP